MSLTSRAVALQRAKVLHKAADFVSHDNTRAIRGLRSWRYVTSPIRSGSPVAHMLRQVEKWVRDETTHESVSAVVSEVLASPATRSHFVVQDALAMRRFLGSVGLFSASEQLLVHAVQAVLSSTSDELSARDVHRFARAVIVAGDTERAGTVLQKLRCLPESASSNCLIAYFELWLHGERAAPEAVLIGPAPATLTDSDVTTLMGSENVMRILMPGSTTWDDPCDAVNGRTNTVYANGQTTRWLTGLPPRERDSLVSRFDEVVVKHMDPWVPQAPNVRIASRISDLYLCGNPNMAQIVAFDRLTGRDRHLFVSGVSFFLGTTAYREDQRREFQDSGVVSDRTGSTGRVFERCSSIASHDQTMNRALLRRLVVSGVVSGSAEFMSALMLDDMSYCIELDYSYGKRRA